jgi:hypothetical protein
MISMRKQRSNKARKSKAKKKRPPNPDASQLALAAVEKLIGGKLSNGMKLKRR